MGEIISCTKSEDDYVRQYVHTLRKKKAKTMKDSEYSLNAKVTQYLHLFLPSQDSQRDNQVHFDAI